jgi:hypothetical protein
VTGQVRLTRDEFAKALRDGRGAALLHALEFGLEGIEDLVQAACLRNPAFDSQCEGSRGQWLYRMFKDTGSLPRISVALLNALSDESEEYSYDQLCELAQLLARDGNADAASVLRDFVLGQDFLEQSSPVGCNSLVLLDGMPALIEIVRRYGRMLIADANQYVEDFEDLTEGSGLRAEANSVLLALAPLDQAVDAYMRNNARRTFEQTSKSDQSENERLNAVRVNYLKKYSLDSILANAAAKKGEYPGSFDGFGRFAPDSDLELVFQRLLSESDPEICLRLFWVFRRGTLPRLDSRLWEFAEHEDNRLREAAMTAISGVRDPAVGNYGRGQLVLTGDPIYIQLLIKNSRPGDERAILDVLGKWTFEDDDVHHRSFAVEAFCKEIGSPAAADLLEWICTHNPCSICRRDAFKILVELACPSPALVHECLHDAHSDTVKLAHDWIHSEKT